MANVTKISDQNGNVYDVKDLVARAAIDELNNKTTSVNGGYTPIFGWSNNSDIQVDNITMRYQLRSGILFINGRFNIVDLGTPGNSNMTITLPSEYSAPNYGVSGFGVMNSQTDVLPAQIRVNGNQLVIVFGSGGNYASYMIKETGYYDISCVIPM